MNLIANLLDPPRRDDVFTQGGQPSITYVDRAHLGLEAALKKAVAQRTAVVSLTGATKAGKTVLCRSVMQPVEYVWIDGGQAKSEKGFWDKVYHELRLPVEWKESEGGNRGLTAGGEVAGDANALAASAKFKLSIGGSRLKTFDSSRSYRVDGPAAAIEHLLENDIVLIVDDFHYSPDETRIELVKSFKGAAFRGLKVILLSTPYRAFEAVKAEPEITGRFKHVTVPDWSTPDLQAIAVAGFKALNVDCPMSIIKRFADEAEGSPLLMQQFCWNLCYDCDIDAASLRKQHIPADFMIERIFREVALDAGLPVYDKLRKGPQTRTERIPRPLLSGESADIYISVYCWQSLRPVLKKSSPTIRSGRA